MEDDVTTIAALEAVIGTCSLGVRMKEIDFLDAHCRRLIDASSFAAVGSVTGNGDLRVHAFGGRAPFARVDARGTLLLPIAPDEIPLFSRGAEKPGVGVLFLIPGLGETLRINGIGRVVPDDATGVTNLVVDVKEAFLHCAKAILRSRLWDDAPATGGESDAVVASSADPLGESALASFLARAPFVLLASANGQGAADVSPKGDPAEFLLPLDGRTLGIPDRPGNRRVDTFRNVLEQSHVALLALAPGDPRVATVRGRARLTRAPEVLARMVVAGNTPKVALVVDVEEARLAPSAALVAADLWNSGRHADLASLPTPGVVLRDHVKQNRTRGVGATLLRTAVTERVVESGLAKDYRDNLY